MTPRATFAPPAPNEQVTLEELPAVAPATSDLLCWLWAATPPKNGRLDIARAARSLAVSDSTVRRWIKNSAGTAMPAPAEKKLPRLAQLAALRGRGQLLWPPLDRAYRQRQLALAEEARRCLEVTQTAPHLASDRWLKPCDIYLAYYPKARVYGLSSGTTPSTEKVIRAAGGKILTKEHLINRHAAILAKTAILEKVRHVHCVPPRYLVPVGRTEVWLHSVGPAGLGDEIKDEWRRGFGLAD